MKVNALVVAAALAVLDFAGAVPFPPPRITRLSPRVYRPKPLNPRASVKNIPLKVWGRGSADFQWYSTIEVGTPPQDLTVLIDTGAPGLVIPGIDCTTCGSDTLFDYTNSSTYERIDTKESIIGFASGGDATPLISPAIIRGGNQQDTVSIGGIAVPGQSFFLATAYPEPFMRMPIDGVLGLAPTADGKGGGWFWAAVENGDIPAGVFSLRLNQRVECEDSGGQLTLGGTDPSQYKGIINYVPLSPATLSGTWLGLLRGFTVDGKTTAGSNATNVVLDSGTAYIQCPSNKVAASIYASISPEIKPIGNLGVYGAPCSVMDALEPEITFDFGSSLKNVKMTLPKSSFNLGPLRDQPNMCQGVFLGAGKSGYTVWIVGSPLIKGYYTVWDLDNNQWGIADLA